MLKLAPLFGNGAVLCRGKEIRIFGEADEGRTVTVTLDGDTASCVARGGRFLARLAPRRAATGCTLTVTDGAQTITSTDVAIGEVYLAGGHGCLMDAAFRCARAFRWASARRLGGSERFHSQ